MTTPTIKQQSQAPPDLHQVASVLEQLLPPGQSITRTKHGWYLKGWTSKATPYGPKMDWFIIAESPDLLALLERLGEHS